MQRIDQRALLPSGAVTLCLITGILWWFTLTEAHRHRAGGALIVFEAVLVAVCTVNLVIMARSRVGLPTLALLFIADVSFVLAIFSQFYWEYGSARDFTHPLTHLDSVYFALGTLSTAGTGFLSATSEAARTIQMVQMGIDIALIVFAVGVIVDRFNPQLRSRRAPALADEHSEASAAQE